MMLFLYTVCGSGLRREKLGVDPPAMFEHNAAPSHNMQLSIMVVYYGVSIRDTYRGYAAPRPYPLLTVRILTSRDS